MGEKEFVKLVKSSIADYVNEHEGFTDGAAISEDDVHVVWLCKALQNNKALASTNLFDGMYYEFTYNGSKKECYVDVYKKQENFCIRGC